MLYNSINKLHGSHIRNPGQKTGPPCQPGVTTVSENAEQCVNDEIFQINYVTPPAVRVIIFVAPHIVNALSLE